MRRFCQYQGISRQAHYQQQQRNRRRTQSHDELVRAVIRIRQSHPRMGTRKLHNLLQQQGLRIGRDRLFDLLRHHRLLVARKRAYHKTTHSHHRFYRHPNLLKPGPNRITPTRPNQVWVADITYLPVRQGEAYLSLITDAHSRKIVGHHVHDNLKTASVVQAFKKALRSRKEKTDLIHHSDRGIQYCSEQYQDVHKKHGVRCSMTDGYDCYQNALAERVNGIIKNEYLIVKPRDIEEARRMVDESIIQYNQHRPHLSLNYKTPDEVHRASAK